MRELKRFGQLLVRQSVVVPLLILYAAGHAFDVISTFIALEFYGMREGNPFLAWLLNSKIPGKWIALSGLKVWHIQSTGFYMKWYQETRTLAWITIFIWAVVFWNFLVILRRRHARS